LVFALLGAGLLTAPAAASADCVTPVKKLAAVVTAKDAYARAKVEAVKWKTDSAMIRMQSTTAGPMDAQGRSAHWMFEFYSPSAKKLEMINVMKGDVSCSDAAVEIVAKPVELSDDAVMLDSLRLYTIAQKNGGSEKDPKTVTLTAMLEQNAEAGAVWTLTYTTPQGMPVLRIRVDAKTGAVLSKTSE
jgi:hypothetical protein